MLYWTQELAPPIQEFQLLVEHYLPSLAHIFGLQDTLQVALQASEKPQCPDSTGSRPARPTDSLLLLNVSEKILVLPSLHLPFRY